MTDHADGLTTYQCGLKQKLTEQRIEFEDINIQYQQLERNSAIKVEEIHRINQQREECQKQTENLMREIEEIRETTDQMTKRINVELKKAS